jgi:processive 1,2-diacylglycerol beta-glucosyltransferase
VDVLALATAPFRYCYAQVYLDLIRWAPEFLGYIYNRFDRPRPLTFGTWDHVRVWLERMNLRPFQALLESEPWDLVINTFFLPAEIVHALRRAGRFHAPQVMVVTDFESHRNWGGGSCDLYCTATQEAALYLQRLGIPRTATTVTGIPIHPRFSEPRDQGACRARHGIRGDRPVVLLMAGGHGASPMAEPFQALLGVEVPLEIIAVTGHNHQAKARLEAVAVPPRHRAVILGYTTAMNELLAASDLAVTKPGGLTVSEALARGVGLVLINPIPGQEERNSDYLLEEGAAIKVNHLATLGYKVTDLLRDPDHLNRLRANARRLARPRAAFDIVERSLALIGYRTGDGRPEVMANGSNGQAHHANGSGGSNGRLHHEANGSNGHPAGAATDGLPVMATHSRSLEGLGSRSEQQR